VPGRKLSRPGSILCLAALGCRAEVKQHPAEQKPATGQADSLILTSPTGAEVWFTLVRRATGENGEQCLERGLEIRVHGKRTRVPLLYTGAAPELFHDTMMRAMLWKNCKPAEPYIVNLHTGQPVPERGANKQ
jgi:hypothetical protein